MKTSRFTDSKIISIFKENENGSTVPDLCRKHGMSSASFYKWRSKFGGMDTSLMKRIKELEDENRRLKKMYIEEKLIAEIAKDIIEKICKASSATRTGETSSD
ncbi:MAG: putative transposase [Bermanella sp.]|jgi:putative transposase